ncbi:uncharacterized protein L3040_004880 [Drepanopeziza brunnea f. sp. 'multigermtubi']|uniref:uncharacterized protein n=1 Tax=Drepanopeziza brunnea f. sp. 'multigermtubi' TaxID=698441 RepID=UPI002388EC77|nr:hypothetical protein L3040_004880 [Drepanopeziza brunnea f. sp. 'multigermtubi']
MFGPSSKSRRDGPIAMPQQPEVYRKHSVWKPALIRVKKGLFSGPGSHRSEIVDLRGAERAFTAIIDRPLISIRGSDDLYSETRKEVDRDIPIHRLPNVPRRKTLGDEQLTSADLTDTSFEPFLQKPKSSKNGPFQESRRTLPARGRGPSDGVGNVPGNDLYLLDSPSVPKHAASDFSQLDLAFGLEPKRSRSVARPKLEPVPRTVAVDQPIHAVSDFSEMNLASDPDVNGIGLAITRSPPPEPMLEPLNTQIFQKSSETIATLNCSVYDAASPRTLTTDSIVELQGIQAKLKSNKEAWTRAISQCSANSRSSKASVRERTNSSAEDGAGEDFESVAMVAMVARSAKHVAVVRTVLPGTKDVDTTRARAIREGWFLEIDDLGEDVMEDLRS